MVVDDGKFRLQRYVAMTPNNGSLLLRAILAHPDEDVPRLMFADWLDESDKPAAHAYARFIREQIKAHRAGVPDGDVARGLFQSWGRDWFGHVFGHLAPAFHPQTQTRFRNPVFLICSQCDLSDQLIGAGSEYIVFDDDEFPSSEDDEYRCYWRIERGFVSVVSAHFPHWERFGDRIVSSQPVRLVRVTTQPLPVEVEEETWDGTYVPRELVFVGGRPFDGDPPIEEALAIRWPSVREWKSPDSFYEGSVDESYAEVGL